MKEVVLSPIKETTEDYEQIEARIAEAFKKYLYEPILAVVGESDSVLKNSSDYLVSAIESGRITFYRGQFKGRFNSTVSRELRKIGAKWDRTQGSWKVHFSSLPEEIQGAIERSELRFQKQVETMDRLLQQILPDEVADHVKVADLFDSTLFKTEKKIEATLKKISIEPTFTPEQRRRVAREYQNNLRLYIKDWTQKEIVKLRKDMQKHALAGNRYEDMIKTIQKSYGVSHNKAKFLARQETSLLMTKFKETRYQEAGVNEYIWGCVAGSPNHPVRPMHKRLEGKKFRWDNPPVVDEQGNKKNPGQDYNCRCFARPVVRFK